jgi:hypothetical protein
MPALLDRRKLSIVRMIQLAKKLDKKLASWRPEVAAQVE